MKLDPRISHMFRGTNAGEQFMATALLALLDSNKLTDKVLADLRQDGIDWTQTVAGRPLYTFNGKSPSFLREKEGLPQAKVDQVQAHLKKHGLSLPADPPPEKPVVQHVEPHVQPPAVQTGSLPPAGNPQADEEPTFANRPLGELALLSDDDLKKIEGIGAATIVKIREAAEARGLAGPAQK